MSSMLLIAALGGVLACGKTSEAPKGVPTPLGTTGATIDLPAGWRLTDKGLNKGHLTWDVESGDMSGTSWRIIWCRTTPLAATLEAFYRTSDACQSETKAGPSSTLPTGAFYVECDKNELGSDLHHVGSAVKIAAVAGETSYEPDEMVHCFANSAGLTADHHAIIKSLRVATKK